MNTTSLSGGNGTSGIVDRAHLMVDKAVDQLAPVVQGASTAAHQTIDKVATATAPAGRVGVGKWAAVGNQNQRTCGSLQRAGPRTAARDARRRHCDRLHRGTHAFGTKSQANRGILQMPGLPPSAEGPRTLSGRECP